MRQIVEVDNSLTKQENTSQYHLFCIALSFSYKIGIQIKNKEL